MISAEELRKVPAPAGIPKCVEREIEKGCLRARQRGHDSASVYLGISYETACAVRAHLGNLGYKVKMQDVTDFREGEPCYVFIISWRAHPAGPSCPLPKGDVR